MKRLLANRVDDTEARLIAYVMADPLVLDNVKEFYGNDVAANLKYALQNKNELHSIARFAQFVGVIRCENIGLSLTLVDFKGNTDSILDEYLRFQANDWEKEDRDKFARIAQEIIDAPNEIAELEVWGEI